MAVCYLATEPKPGGDPATLTTRIVLTNDASKRSAETKYVRGVDQACAVVREWMQSLVDDPVA